MCKGTVADYPLGLSLGSADHSLKRIMWEPRLNFYIDYAQTGIFITHVVDIRILQSNRVIRILLVHIVK